MTIITVAKAKEKDNENINITTTNISLPERLIYNELINNEIIVNPNESLPFILRKIITKGVIPIYNSKTFYETRIITDKTVLGIDIESNAIQQLFEHKNHKIETDEENLLFDNILWKDIIKNVPYNTPINIIGLIIPDTLIKENLIVEILYPFNKNKNYYDYRFDFTSYVMSDYYQHSALIDLKLHTYPIGIYPPKNPMKYNNILDHEKVQTNDTSYQNFIDLISYKYLVYKPERAYNIYASILNSLEYLRSSTSILYRKRYLDHLMNVKLDDIYIMNMIKNLTYVNLPLLSIDEKMLGYYKYIKLSIPYTEYESIPTNILIINNEYEDYLHMLFNQKYKRDRIAETKYVNRQVLKELVKVGKYSFIFKTLYGESEFNKLKPKNHTLSALLAVIPPDKIKRIEKEIEELESFWNTLNNNKCDHINVINRLNKAINQDEYRKVYEQIKNYINHDDKDTENMTSFCLCKLCKLRLICPHKFITIDYVINGKTFDQIKHDFEIFVDKDSQYKSSVICRICNEELYKKEYVLPNEHKQIIISEHRNALWKDASYMIHNYVKFSEAIYDKTVLIRNMVNSCYSIIISLVNNLPLGSNIDQWRSIFADKVFAAYLLNIEKITGNDITFNYNLFLGNISISQKISTRKAIDEYRKQLSDIEVTKVSKQDNDNSLMYSNPIYKLGAMIMKMDIVSFCAKYVVNVKLRTNRKEKINATSNLPLIKIDDYIYKHGSGNTNILSNIISDKLTDKLTYKDNKSNENSLIQLHSNINFPKDNITNDDLSVLFKDNIFDIGFNPLIPIILPNKLSIKSLSKKEQDIYDNIINKNDVNVILTNKDNEELIINNSFDIHDNKDRDNKDSKNNFPDKIKVNDIDLYNLFTHINADDNKNINIQYRSNNDNSKQNISIIKIDNIKNNKTKGGKNEKVQVDKINNYKIKKDNKNELNKLRDKQVITIYNLMVKYYKTGLWMVIGNIDHPYSYNISDKNEVDFINHVDKVNNKQIQVDLLRPVIMLLDSGKYEKSEKRDKFNLCELYNEQGELIKWDKFVYDSKIVDRSEASLIKYKKFPDDMYSSKNDLYRSKSRLKDDSNMLTIIESIQLSESILSYYFNICPEGGSHQREKTIDKCKKCGLYLDISGNDKRDYIIKYKNKYENSKSNIQKTMSNTVPAIKFKKIAFGEANRSVIKLDSNDIDKWIDIKLTDEMLTQMSFRYGETTNVWNSIGQCEKIKYDDIVTGAAELEPPDNLNSYIIFRVNSYINVYFTYKIKKGYNNAKQLFNIYNELYSYKKMFTSKKISDIENKAIELLNWMKAFFYIDAIQFNEEDNELSNTIIKQIIKSDTLLCKNDLMLAVTSTLFEADLIGIDDLAPILDDIIDNEGEMPIDQ